MIFNGSFAFNGSETGLDFADFLLGVASSYTQGQARSFYNRNLYMAAFAQDSWKATSQLTVNYGVRWDRIRPWQREIQPVANAGQGRAVAGLSRRAAGAGLSRRPRRARARSPRRATTLLRASASRGRRPSPHPWLRKLTGPAGQTSIRAGYGIFYTAYEGLSAGIMSANPPYGYTYTSAAPPLFASPFTVAATGARRRASASRCKRWPTAPAAPIPTPP